jgi:hypothetical protein
MSTSNAEAAAVIPITVLPLVRKYTGNLYTDSTLIKLKAWRAVSGGFEILDWSNMTFRTKAAVAQLLQDMTEVDKDNFPGEYYYSLDLSTITNLEQGDNISFTVVETVTSDVANLPQAGALRISPAHVDAILARKSMFNDYTLTAGSVNNLVLKDDDGITDLQKWNVKDPNGLGIAIDSGYPAIREKA